MANTETPNDLTASIFNGAYTEGETLTGGSTKTFTPSTKYER